MRIFIRQCLTETRSLATRQLIQEVFDEILAAAGSFSQATGRSVSFSPGAFALRASYNGDFRERFEEETGRPFSPAAFEQWRDKALREADIFVAVRTALSESTAVEIGRFTELRQDGWERCFILMADTPEATMHTTLLRNATLVPFATAPGEEESARRLASAPQLRSDILSKIFDSPWVRRYETLRPKPM